MTRAPGVLILASRSPRRADLLRAAGYRFLVDAPSIDETPLSGETPRATAMRLAREKAEAVSSRRRSARVLGADTLVEVRGRLFGKPRDEDDARRMLRALSGRTHRVITGVAIRSPRGEPANLTACSVTSVRFARLTPRQIDWYVATGEPLDKAGAYAIQGRASLFVREIRGSYSNVIGLPLEVVFRMLGTPA